MSLFYDPTTIQHNNSIKIEHRMHSMRNHNDSAVLELLANDLLDLGIRLCIQADCERLALLKQRDVKKSHTCLSAHLVSGYYFS